MYVEDILDAITRINRYTSGMSIESFGSDELFQDAAVRSFAVIGEAAGHVPAEMQSSHPEIPCSRMRGMRNFLIHDYSNVDYEIIWGPRGTTLLHWSRS